MPRAVIFDFDGTIADTLPIVMEIAKDIAEREGKEIPEDLDALRDQDVHALMNLLKVPKYKLPIYMKEFRSRLHERLDEVEVFDGMGEVIETLVSDYRLAVLTSNDEDSVAEFLESHDLMKHFETIHAGITLFGKAGKIKKLLKEMEVDKEDAVYIGDGERDVEACIDDEVSFIGVSWGFNTERLLRQSGAENIAEQPQDIINMIRSMK